MELETTTLPNVCVTYSSSLAGPSRLSQMAMFAALETFGETKIIIAGERSLGGIETPSTGELLAKEFPGANITLIDDGTRLINTVLQMRAIGEAGFKEVGRVVCFNFHKRRVAQALGWAGVKIEGVITVEEILDEINANNPEQVYNFLHGKLKLNEDVNWPTIKENINREFGRRELKTIPVQSILEGKVLNLISQIWGHGRYDDLEDDGTPILSHTHEA
jgi:hypothetical protein